MTTETYYEIMLACQFVWVLKQRHAAELPATAERYPPADPDRRRDID